MKSLNQKQQEVLRNKINELQSLIKKDEGVIMNSIMEHELKDFLRKIEDNK